MDFKYIFTDVPILIVLAVFIFSMFYTVKNYLSVSKNLKILYNFISQFKKSDLNFRFKEIDEWMELNPFVSHYWHEFKNTLVFSESVVVKNKNNRSVYKEVSSTVQNIQTTVDPIYFFNEESLVGSKFNKHLITSIPTVLTGFGPLFTFLNIAVAFGKIDFSTQARTIESVSGLMISMQAAAMVSVVAVGSSLCFMVYEKLMYNFLCKQPLSRVEECINTLFDNISSEKFLLELLKETKIQNSAISGLISALPVDFKTALDSGISSTLVPYLENVIYGVNQLNKNIKEAGKSDGDVVDELF
jgi:hypothetical protein